MIPIEEDRLRFEFGDRWSVVVKWDNHQAFVGGIQGLNGELDNRVESSKAVDVVAEDDSSLVLLEIKDFRSRPQQPVALDFAGRRKTLPLEVALKVRDTLAGLVGVALRAHPPDIAEACSRKLTKRVRVVAYVLEERRASMPETKRKVREKELRDGLKQKLGWLHGEVHLVQELQPPSRALPEVVVTSR